MKSLLVFVALLFASLSVQAHNVVGGVYATGADIEGEAGFSNGDMAKAGTEVIISDAAGNELGRTQTDDEGYFIFTARSRIEHHFRIEMGAGHLLEMTLPVEELPESLPSGEGVVATSASKAASSTPTALGEVDQQALSQMIEKAVAKQVKPLRKELNAFKEKAGYMDIIGAMGYIFGLVGLGMYLRYRKVTVKGAN